MISEMVERLRSLARVNTDDTFRLLWGAADTIEDLSEKVRNNNLHGGWTLFAEKKPPVDEEILITYNCEVIPAYYERARYFVDLEGLIICSEEYVVAWMHKPEPFKE